MKDGRYAGKEILWLTEDSFCPGNAYKKGREVILTDNNEAVAVIRRNDEPALISIGCWPEPRTDIMEPTGIELDEYVSVTNNEIEKYIIEHTVKTDSGEI